MVQFAFGGLRHRVDDYVALALLARLEGRESGIAVEIARSLSHALARGVPTEIVLDDDDCAELRSMLDEWASEHDLAGELRWLHRALWGERLPWDMLAQGRAGLASPGLTEPSRTPFRRPSPLPERRSGTRRR